MRPGREIDTRIAQEIFGYEVFAKNKVLHEVADKGLRPLRTYTKEMQWAWLVAEKMRVSLIPIEGGQWFAFASEKEGWSAPDAFLEYLKGGDFTQCGAAVNENPAQAICEAALVAYQKQKSLSTEVTADLATSSSDSGDATDSSSQPTPSNSNPLH